MDSLPSDMFCFSEKECEILSAQAEREGELNRKPRVDGKGLNDDEWFVLVFHFHLLFLFLSGDFLPQLIYC